MILTEPRISFPALARREGVHVSTVWRWALRGCKGYKLEAFSVGGKKFTTLPSYERWLAAINGRPVESEKLRQREQGLRRAEKLAREQGV